jgi:hypothetical protein
MSVTEFEAVKDILKYSILLNPALPLQAVIYFVELLVDTKLNTSYNC